MTMQEPSPTCWAVIPAKEVILEKVREGHGKLPVGTTFRWDYKTTTDFEARARARRALTRDHPAEEPMDWMEVHR